LVGGDPWSFLSHLDPNRVLVGYLSWSFRTSFSILFLSLSIGFFALIIIFAFIMMILGSNFPTCSQPNFNEANTPFADAYALSWTTFTTVVSISFLLFNASLIGIDALLNSNLLIYQRVMVIPTPQNQPKSQIKLSAFGYTYFVLLNLLLVFCLRAYAVLLFLVKSLESNLWHQSCLVIQLQYGMD